ncbi:MAG TPA: hypothetical protein VKX16_06500 [Chloroflexota bacterium]|nr:hypothetical protein [Chloroflexota bacterium]
MRVLLRVLASGAVVASAIWWIAAVWDFEHPQVAPSLLTNTTTMLAAVLLGLLVLLLGGLVLLLGQERRYSAIALALSGLLSAAGPIWVVGDTFTSLNDWDFANRTFLTAYLPAVAFLMDRELPQTDHVPHFVIHHADPVPAWEVADLERQWQRLSRLTGSEPRNGIVLYLNDTGADALGIGHHGAAYGPLVIALPLTLVDPCSGGSLHEIAHAFMYVQSKGNTFPQLLDEGWAVANQGCPEHTLDQQVLADIESGLMPPLEDRLTDAGFRAARYGGANTGYDAGGSFVSWLLTRYGAARFMSFINSATVASFQTRAHVVYGAPLASLEATWLSHIAREFGMRALAFTSDRNP